MKEKCYVLTGKGRGDRSAGPPTTRRWMTYIRHRLFNRWKCVRAKATRAGCTRSNFFLFHSWVGESLEQTKENNQTDKRNEKKKRSKQYLKIDSSSATV